MESTKQNRVWHDGPPPHVGWWNASALRDKDMWRWWDGDHWSWALASFATGDEVKRDAERQSTCIGIQWNDYWPANARVPRLAPEDFEVGARWVCVDPVWSWEYRWLDFTVTKVTDVSVTLASYRSIVVEKLECLPSEYYVPRRCIGPQTRWYFPTPKLCRDCADFGPVCPNSGKPCRGGNRG